MRYCALPDTLDAAEMTEGIRDAYRALDFYLGEKGLEERGPSIIRYRRSSEGGTHHVEIGWVMPDIDEVERPFVVETLPEGSYVVGWHNGAYARIGETTRELISWGDARHVTWDVEVDDDGEAWASWYELYLTEPSFGPEGPVGSVEVCLRVRE